MRGRLTGPAVRIGEGRGGGVCAPFRAFAGSALHVGGLPQAEFVWLGFSRMLAVTERGSVPVCGNNEDRDMSRTYRVAAIAGDSIGQEGMPEVGEAIVAALEAAR